ncbi:MAG: hypothetical protein RIS08_1284 [Actinomycetota bacterium]|jgi:glucose-1-phosphate cytidylyltransferase
MKVVILAGGYGTRMSELTDVIPKPMVPIGGKPILWHIMNHYASFGHKDFVIALGYKSEVIKDYFYRLGSLATDFTINLVDGTLSQHGKANLDWRVTLVDTGEATLTGTRLKMLEPHLGSERFMLTYGDGVSSVDIGELLDFHEATGALATMTAVHPAARFGELTISETGLVSSFEEKPQLQQGWINGGFFVFEPEVFQHIPDQNCMLEREPLNSLTSADQLAAYKHEGFWQCMDSKRDMEHLQALWMTGTPPWVRT